MDLVGIEPTTSSMPWKYQGRPVLTAKDLRAGTVGKTGKSALFATKNREWVNGAELWGDQLHFSSSDFYGQKTSTLAISARLLQLRGGRGIKFHAGGRLQVADGSIDHGKDLRPVNAIAEIKGGCY